MADYEVRVVPTLDVDTEHLQGQLKELGKTIGKSSGKIRVQAELDTRNIEKQLQHIGSENQAIEIDAQVSPRSARDVEKEIRDRIKRIEDLSDVQASFEHGANRNQRDIQTFNEVAESIALAHAEYQKLVQLRNEWQGFDKGQTALLNSERNELARLEDSIEIMRISAEDLQEEFHKLHKSTLELPVAEIPVGLDEARITESARQVLSAVQDNLSDASVNVDIVVSEATMRTMESNIESLQTKFTALEQIISNTQNAVDAQAVPSGGDTPVNIGQQAVDILDLYNQQAVAINGIVNDIKGMDEATRALFQTNAELLTSFQALQNKVANIENSTQHFQTVLSTLGKDIAIEPTVAIDDALIMSQLNNVKDVINSRDFVIETTWESNADNLLEQIREAITAIENINNSRQTASIPLTQEEELNLLQRKKEVFSNLIQLKNQLGSDFIAAELNIDSALSLNEECINRSLDFINHRLEELSRSFNLPINMVSDDMHIQGSVRHISQVAQDAANEQPVNLAVQIGDTNFEEMLQTILKKGAEAQSALNDLGPDSHTRVEIKKEAEATGQALDELIQKYQREGLYVEKLTQKLKAQRAVRDELTRFVEQSQHVMSGNLEMVDGDVLTSLGVDPTIFGEYIRKIELMQIHAKNARQDLGHLAEGLKRFAVETETSHSRGYELIPDADGQVRLWSKKKEIIDTVINSTEAFGHSLEDIAERYGVVVRSGHEIGVTKEYFDSLTSVVENFNQSIAATGENTAKIFGAIDIPSVNIEFAADAQGQQERISHVINDIEIQPVNIPVSVDASEAVQDIGTVLDKVETAAGNRPIEITFADIESKVQELGRLQEQLEAIRHEIYSAEGVFDSIEQARHDPQRVEQLRRTYEGQGRFVADNAEQLKGFTQQKEEAVLEFQERIEAVSKSILELGQNSGDIPAAINFITESLNKANESTTSFAATQQQTATEIAESLQTIIDAYKNFVIPDRHAGKGSKAFKAYQKEFGQKDLRGRWKYQDDAIVGRRTLEKLTQQKNLLSQAQQLAREYHEALNGDSSGLNKSTLDFLGNLQDKLNENIELAAVLRQAWGVDDAIPAQMNKHIGEQIRELQSLDNPFEAGSQEWYETKHKHLTKLITLSEQYGESLKTLNSAGFLSNNEIPNIRQLQTELASLPAEQIRVAQTHDESPVNLELHVDKTNVKDISGAVQDIIDGQPAPTATIETDVNMPQDALMGLDNGRQNIEALDKATKHMITNFVKRMGYAGVKAQQLEQALESLARLQPGELAQLSQLGSMDIAANEQEFNDFINRKINIVDGFAQSIQNSGGQISEAFEDVGTGVSFDNITEQIQEALAIWQQLKTAGIGDPSDDLQSRLDYLKKMKQAASGLLQLKTELGEAKVGVAGLDSAELKLLDGWDESLNTQIQKIQAQLDLAPLGIQIKGQFDSSLLDAGSHGITPPEITELPPVPLTGELHINDKQVHEAFVVLNQAIQSEKAVSHESLALTAEKYQAQREAIVAVKDALQGLIKLYGEHGNKSTDGLADADLSDLTNLLNQFAQVQLDISKLDSEFVNLQKSLQTAKEDVTAKVSEVNGVLGSIGDIETDEADIRSIIADVANALGELNSLSTDTEDLGLQLDGFTKAKELLQQLISLHGEYTNMDSRGTQDIEALDAVSSRLKDIQTKLQGLASVSLDGFDTTTINRNIDEAVRHFEDEKRIAQELNQTWQEHPQTMQDAADAEQAKLKTSQALETQLRKEAQAVTELGNAVERAESVGEASPMTGTGAAVDVDLSNLRFKGAPDAASVQRQLQAIFDEALSRQDDFLTAKVRLSVSADGEIERAIVAFQDNLGRKIEQIYGLAEAANSILGTAAQDAGDNISTMTGEAERQFQHLRTTIAASFGEDNKFSVDFHQNLAQQQIDTLENQSKGLGIIFDGLRESASNIVDPSSLQDFSNQMTLMKESIRTAKADIQGMNRLDPVAAMQRNIDGFDTRLGALSEKMSRLEATGFNEIASTDFSNLQNSIAGISSELTNFQATQSSLNTDEKVAAFNHLSSSLAQAEGQFKLLSQQQTTHKQKVADYLRVIKQIGDTQRSLNRTEASDTARRNNLQNQLNLLESKAQAYEALRLSALELTRVEEARATAAARASVSTAGTATRAAPKEISDTQFRVFEQNIVNLEERLSRITASIDTDEAQASILRVQDAIGEVKTALQGLRDTSGTEMQKDAMSEYRASLQLAKQAVSDLRSEEMESAGLTRLSSQIEQITGRLNKMNVNWSAFRADPELAATWSSLSNEAARLSEEFANVVTTGNMKDFPALNRQYQELSQRVRGLTTDIQGAGKAKAAFGDAVLNTSKKFGAYLVSMFSFYRVISMFQRGLRYIHEIDRAMTALRRVTDETARTYNQFLTDAYQRARRLGTSVNQIINASADFARLGLENSPLIW